MYTLSHLYVPAHLDEQLKAAAQERRAEQKPSQLKAQISAGAKSVWSLLSGPAERPMTLPTLTNYPYRG